MRSATKHALAAVKREIDTLTQVDTDSVNNLFGAVDVLAESKPLASALVERGVPPESKRSLVERVFGSQLGGPATRVLATVVAQNWESAEELVQVTQEAAIRALAQATGNHEQLGSELNAFLDTVLSNGELELSLGTRLQAPETKVALVNRLFGQRLSADTIRILTSLFTNSGGRRTRRLVSWARDVVADQANRQVAVVTVARGLNDAQLDRLKAGLAARFGREVAVNQVIDPAVIGGMRIEFGDVVIDDTAAARLHDLRLQLA
ncbi:F0F1 ATP synthase subunit delta [Gulosibacter molinativorax]|uniref:ATP synthase subunit delta n=1 Tax=Gulosibacter molinativorax TaxID=256821 RepID=A0ABT7C3N9_9MICO|nr:F0F1 ATP synthase subunit delta [Gulosibacter molinativorax]MDJ1369873.1 F0F1 ATP synthase subunit delta [Gulosibacter molinativorax]QUY61838.1 ATP synthase subunit delta [Gulosibacter molinativorax]